jgi:SAM-dependent methyltransferase
MKLKQSLVRLLNPESKIFAVLYQARHPIKTLKRFQMTLTKSSIFNDEDDLHGCSLLPAALLEGIIKTVNPTSVLDVGCGAGRSLDWFLEKGIEVVGLEGSSIGIKHARNPQHIIQTNLNEPVDIGRRFDLVWCFEVAEHIHPNYTEVFIQSLVVHSDCIMISAAHPGQGGVGHFNEQPRSYWLSQFNRFGFEHDDTGRLEIIENWTWFPENIFLFRRKMNPNG